MNPVLVAIVAVLIFGVGIYIGVSGLTAQYGVGTSGSGAAAAACAPQSPTAVVGKSVGFIHTGIPGGIVYHWASDEGRSELAPDGTLRVTFADSGTKEVSLFWLDGAFWRRIACSVVVR